MLKPVYISGSASISPQRTLTDEQWWNELVVTESKKLKCIEPEYSSYLNPIAARRMGRIVKMGIAAATEALKDSAVEMPGAIITGTALGCLGDTEKFLTSVIKDNEQFLTPTWFIQSLQNTVSAQIALQLKCMNHNFTFVHKGFSFESALLDAMMLINENEADNILVGGLDEMTDHNFTIYNRLGKWKSEPVNSLELLKHNKTNGTIAGEGASFFMLSSQPSKTVLSGIHTIYSENESVIESQVQEFIQKHEVELNSSTLILNGLNGDPKNDQIYHQLISGTFRDCSSGYFKHLCGEYQTSSAFAMWLAYSVLENNYAPNILQVPGKKFTTKPGKILVVNHYENNYSLMLFSTNQ